MKRTASILLVLVMMLSLMVPTAFAADDYKGSTVILYTGNLRGDVDTYAQIAAAKADYESKGADVILVDAGNYLQGTAAANYDRGETVYDLMNAAGYDVAAMGLAEFGYGEASTGYVYHGNVTKYYTQAELQKGAEALTYNQNRDGSATADREARDAAKFAVVAANVTGENEFYAFDASTVVTTKSGLKVGFYGLTDSAVAENIQDTFAAGLTFAKPEAVKVDGCDVTVCLSNAGVSGETYGDILIEAGTAKTVGAYVIDNAAKTVTKEEVTLSGSNETVAALAAAAKEAAGEAVGKSEVILNGADSVNWNRESNLGDLTTDALVWYAKNYIDGIDADLPIVALQNGGNCDHFLYTGEITEADLLKALPFSPMGIGVLNVTGEQLLETIEAATQSENCPGFAQVSGLTYTLNTAAEYDAGEAYGNFFEADSINRVTITSVNGKDFDPAATYALVCDNFLLNGNDTYYTLKNVKEAEGAVYVNNGNGVKVRDAVAMYIKEVLNGVIGSDYAKPQGRITITNEAPVTENPFTDVPEGQYYTDAVLWAYSNKVVNGATATSFAPENNMTHAELWTILARQKGVDVSGGSPWYAAARAWVITEDISDGTKPDADITREELAMALYSFAGSPEVKGDLSSFPDAGDVSADAVDAMAWAVAEKLINGSDGKLLPGGTATRAQVVTILWRYTVK